MSNMSDNITNDFNYDAFLQKEKEKNRHRERVETRKYKEKKDYYKQLKKFGYDN